MPNRALQAKAFKLTKQLAKRPRPDPIARNTVGEFKANGVRPRPMPSAMPVSRDANTFGDFQRRGAILAGCFETGSRLIRNGQVVS